LKSRINNHLKSRVQVLPISAQDISELAETAFVVFKDDQRAAENDQEADMQDVMTKVSRL
jgi:hypothetical protein